jgi:hypothetical protein
MPITLGNSADPGLEPAAAAASVTELGMDATKRALDNERVTGRAAIKLIEKAAVPIPSLEDLEREGRARHVDRKA